MFALKKAISAFLFPVPLILILIGIGLIFLWSTKRQKLGRWLVSIAFVLLSLASFAPVADGLLGKLEYRWEIFDVSNYRDLRPDWIVVVGGGFSDDEDSLPIHRLSIHSSVRLKEGLRLAAIYPDAILLLSGGPDWTGATGAELMREVALQDGFGAERIVLDAESRDTDDQSRNIASVVGERPFILVTSASHMTRAMAMFQKQGLQPIAAPTGFQAYPGKLRTIAAYLPSSLSLVKTRTAVYEWLGLTWARIRGHI